MNVSGYEWDAGPHLSKPFRRLSVLCRNEDVARWKSSCLRITGVSGGSCDPSVVSRTPFPLGSAVRRGGFTLPRLNPISIPNCRRTCTIYNTTLGIQGGGWNRPLSPIEFVPGNPINWEDKYYQVQNRFVRENLNFWWNQQMTKWNKATTSQLFIRSSNLEFFLLILLQGSRFSFNEHWNLPKMRNVRYYVKRKEQLCFVTFCKLIYVWVTPCILILQFNGLDWSLLVKHLVIKDNTFGWRCEAKHVSQVQED